MVEAGADDDFGRPPGSMVPIVTPPFYAGQIWPIVSNTQGGPVHDAEQRIVDVHGEPIPRLYAAGETMGEVFYYNYPGATSVLRGAVFGRIAGREHSGNAAHSVAVDGDVAPAVQSHADLRQHAVRLGVQEPHGQQSQLGLNLELAAGHFYHRGTVTVGPFLPLDPHRVQLFQFAVTSRK